jgi:hypothetical protein
VTTFGDLINDVLLAIEGWGMNQGRADFINMVGGIDADDLSITVDSGANLGAGVAEIEDELVYIQSVSGQTVTIAPDGRGYRGTTAATHADNTRITMNPLVPRQAIKRAINDTISGVYPKLRGKGSTEFTYAGSTTTYNLPAECDEVLQVTYDAVAPSGEWPRVYHYTVDTNANTTDYAGGKSISVYSVVENGRTVRVIYTKKPSTLSASADLLTSTGLEDTARAVIVAGAVWRLTSYFTPALLRVDSVAIDAMSATESRLDPARVASYLRAQYEVELAEEQQRQRFNQPPTMSFGG